MEHLNTLTVAALIIFCALNFIPILRKDADKNLEEFFGGKRNIPFWALSLSFVASWWGAGSALSTVDLAFDEGLGAFWYYGVPVLIAAFLLLLGAKRIRRVAYLTQGQMMEQRYSRTASVMLSVMIFLFMTASAASQMVGMGMVWGTYLNLGYENAVIGGTAVVVLYSVFGGFRAVVLTDIIQFIFLLLAVVIVFAVCYAHSGGWDAISLAALSSHKNNFMSIDAGAEKYFTYVITFGCSWMIQANVWQRVSAATTDNDAQKMAFMSFLVYIPLYFLPVFTGIAAMALFPSMPDGGIVSAVIDNFMSPTLGLLVFMGISAAIMSTMDSLINTGAMTLVLDLPISRKPFFQSRNYCSLATVIVSALALCIALHIRSILDITWIASDIITTGAFVPLLFGFFWKKGSNMAAIASMCTGICYSAWNLCIFLGINLPSFWKAQSAEQVLLGISLSLVIYFIFSLCSKENNNKAMNFIKKSTYNTIS